ncbi:MAG: ornithine carbamoyltransferase [Acidimicrobiales bacterium]
MRHLLEIDDLTPQELRHLCDLAVVPPADLEQTLARQGVACVFTKPSARTRNSTEMAVVQLGGHPVYITADEVGIDTRETAEDVARTFACYHRVLCARVHDHRVLERMAALDVLPVVNLLSDDGHPLQALADILTIEAEYGTIEGRVVTYVGDANNVARSLTLAVGYLGGEMRVASPPGYGFSEVDAGRLRVAGVDVALFDRPAEAIDGADVIYTDTWISMGQEAERADRLRAFEGFMVDERLMAAAGHAVFLHCLPAHRGEEVSDAVLDGDRSRIWNQAANRLAAVRAVLAWITDGSGGG